MQYKFLLFFFLLITVVSHAQTGIVSGKITDEENSQPLVGATITIKPNAVLKTISDVDGVYRFNKLQAGKYLIEVSYVGYNGKEISDISVTANQVTTLNISLSSAKNTTLENVIVKTEARRETINSILNTRRNAAVVSDAISADMIKRSPDKNVGDVLKRVSGTSIQDNKYVVVRGMSDRYNEALLNGTVLPSTESDRKTFAFDIFPSDLVDNITVIKSASAEYPGSFAGGLVIVNLKDVPDKSFFSFKVGGGYNSITTRKLFYHQKYGKDDFIGFDDGSRNLPKNFPSTGKYNSIAPESRIKYAKELGNDDWKLYRTASAPYNTAMQLAGAYITKGNGFPKFGALLGVSYNSTYRTSHLTNRDYGEITLFPPDSIGIASTYYSFKDVSYTHNILSSALGNFTLKVNPENKFFFNNLLSVNTTSETVTRSGLNDLGNGLTPFHGYIHSYQNNVLYNGQVGGEHYFSKYKLRFKWLTYYTNYQKNEPDYRQMLYFKPEGVPYYFGYLSSSPTLSTTQASGGKFYYDTKDIAKGINLDFIKTFTLLNNVQSLKFGFASFDDSRKHDGRLLRIDPTDAGNFDQSYLTLPSTKIFNPNNFNYDHGLVLTDIGAKQYYFYYGSQKNRAYYIMLDNKLTKQIRFSYGLRYEDYTNVLHSYQDQSTKLKVDRTFHDYLPSANFIYSVLPKANIRLSYSKTVARPLYRELASTLFYDFLQNATYYGRDLLETKINNYEVRWEQYFNNAQYYSVSGFYKKFKNAIEQQIGIDGADSKTLTWGNAPNATNTGVEIEARKNLGFITPALSNFYLYGNAAFIKSVVHVKGNGSDTANRPLQGQSPYILNASVQYSEPKLGINFSALYNVLGSRISIVGGKQTNYYWEKIHPQLDFKISKVVLKNGFVELSWADVLHKNNILFWDENNNKKYDSKYPDIRVQSESFGSVISLSFSYRF